MPPSPLPNKLVVTLHRADIPADVEAASHYFVVWRDIDGKAFRSPRSTRPSFDHVLTIMPLHHAPPISIELRARRRAWQPWSTQSLGSCLLVLPTTTSTVHTERLELSGGNAIALYVTIAAMFDPTFTTLVASSTTPTLHRLGSHLAPPSPWTCLRRVLMGRRRPKPMPPRSPRCLDYIPQAFLGHGTYGTVFAAYHPGFGRTVAVKIVPKSRKRQMFLAAEVAVWTQLTDQPHVSPLLQTFQLPRSVCFVSPCVRGGTLADQRRKSPQWPVDGVRFLAAQLVAALHAVHARGIVLRDLKPPNILIDYPSGYIALTDFGLAARQADAPLNHVCGTTAYMAPEILLHAYDQQVDMWALGVILFEVAVGKLPFHLDPPWCHKHVNRWVGILTCQRVDFPRDMDPAAQDFIEGLLRPDPRRRLRVDTARQHRFFRGMDWTALASRNLVSPFPPQLLTPKTIDPDLTLDEIDKYSSGEEISMDGLPFLRTI
ncbi:Aste57867_13437 [Aphanomyces stellatus]|uniref:Aste57867_13437 protein n=1 Tax=Aphanomyces stellatus TaxID=120398 RepID=A0A485KYV8_9STRA|nr:hypothetical protein As57867_013387 [Aphanomyces stellatus]VFT90276.1 Aste57867_13437 [Aphanomyces stellatus]